MFHKNFLYGLTTAGESLQFTPNYRSLLIINAKSFILARIKINNEWKVLLIKNVLRELIVMPQGHKSQNL